MTESAAPGIGGIHHFFVTVSDIEASLAWYQRLLGANRVPMKFPHYGCEDTGYGGPRSTTYGPGRHGWTSSARVTFA
ncbi:MAG: VOC family protein [Mycobacterium sp.]|jgi:catechol 2,3-dioxygenase-like lactoylglutathione lyase family enzyme